MSTITTEQFAKNIIAKLAITAPGLSLELGTPERKIIEAVSEALFEVQVDSHLVSNQLDIDTKSGADLEDFVGVFAFGRLQGGYATGSITFSLNIPATQQIVIAYGSQVFKPGTSSAASIVYATTAVGTIDIGQTSVTIPAQCTTVGTVGNTPSDTITGYASGAGISTVTNVEPFSGGRDDETDDELRTRFKKTFLRNIAGTSDFYISLASQAVGVKRVQILGPTNKFDCQIQAGTAGVGVNLPSKNCKFVWPDGYSVSKDKGSPDQEWFTDITDYTISTGAISVPVLTPTGATANEFLDVTYEYTSMNSRNDPTNGIANKVDIYVDGSAPTQITEKIFTKAITLNNTFNSKYNVANFKSYPTGTTLTAGVSVFQRLGSTPILTWPTSLIIDAVTYELGTDYFGVRDITLNQGSEREISGIVWIGTPPADNEIAFATYTYNQIPEVLNGVIKKSKQITSDPLVHSVFKKFLAMYIVVQYDLGASPTEVTSRVQSALSNYMSSLSFGAWIQLSDIITFVHNVPGIDNARMATVGGDGVPFMIAEREEGVNTGVYHTTDFQLDDNVVPALDAVFLVRRSFNTFS